VTGRNVIYRREEEVEMIDCQHFDPRMSWNVIREVRSKGHLLG